MASQTAGKPSIRVLLIEDTDADAQIAQDVLAKDDESSFSITRADRLAKGLERLRDDPPDVVLMDLQLPDARGLEVLLSIRKQAPWVPVIALTATYDERQMARELLQHGAQDYLEKGYIQVYHKLLGRSIRYAIERARVEGELRQAHAENERLLGSVPSILIGLASDGKVTHWNAVAEATFGIRAAEVIGKPLAACPVRWDADRILRHLSAMHRAGGPSRLNDVVFTRPDGQERVLGISVVPMELHGASDPGFLLFGADITERKQAEAERLRLQDELAQAQKMETFGRFAGGIAHDFNNFLQVILGFTWLIRSRAKEDRNLLSDLQEISHAADSASAMVRQLLAFGRRQPLQPKVFDINPAVAKMERLLRQLVGEKIALAIAVPGEPLMVKLDPTGLEQVLINLCSNARDSMPDGGKLAISISAATFDQAMTRRHAWARPGEFVRLSVSDTGAGMEPEVAGHIFEPFFTTKKPGKGTGLGLAVVYGVVTQHEGFLNVETAPGRGTTFTVCFPRQQAPAAGAPSAHSSDAASAPPPSGNGAKRQLLVVDDEASILALCERILGERYDVTVVASGREALSQLAARPFDLLITDLKMPEMDGLELLQEVAKVRPAQRAIVMTGYLSQEKEQELLRVGSVRRILRKPFDGQAIQQAVHEHLAETG